MIFDVVKMYDVEPIRCEPPEARLDRDARGRRTVIPAIELAPARGAVRHRRLPVRARHADLRAQRVLVARQRRQRATEALLGEATAIHQRDLEEADATYDC